MLTWTVKFQSCCVIIRKSVYSPVTNCLKIQTMTLIANPIYDSVFKYMMEDDRVAKILLSGSPRFCFPLCCRKTSLISR